MTKVILKKCNDGGYDIRQDQFYAHVATLEQALERLCWYKYVNEIDVEEELLYSIGKELMEKIYRENITNYDTRTTKST